MKPINSNKKSATKKSSSSSFNIFNKFRQAIKNVPGNQPSQNNPNVYFQTSPSIPRPESLIAAKPSGMVSWNNSPSSVWGCMGTWVSGYSQPLGIELGNVCPNFRSFYWTWDFFFSMVGWKINNNSPTIWDFPMCVFCGFLWVMGFSHVCVLCFFDGLGCVFLLLGPNFLDIYVPSKRSRP